MKNQTKKLLLAIEASAVLMLPVLVSAQTITGLVANVAAVILNVADFAVVVLWVLTGLLFLSAQGAPDKLGKAKLALFASIAGTVIIVIVQFIGIGGLISNALQAGT